MSTSLQAMIEQANRRTKRANQQAFVKRVDDRQMLEELKKRARAVVDAYDRDRDYAGLRASLEELRTAVVIAERRAK
jgi:predicted transcriptional regulator